MKTPVFKRATCGLISLKAWPEKVSVCATPAGPGRSFLPRGREAGRAEGEHRVTRSCVSSGGWSISPLQQTLSVSCHERGALYFVDKEAEKQLSKGGKTDERSTLHLPRGKGTALFVPSQQPAGRLGLPASSAVFLAPGRVGSLPPSKRSRSETSGGRLQARAASFAGAPAAGEPGPATRSATFSRAREGRVHAARALRPKRGRGRCAAARSLRVG